MHNELKKLPNVKIMTRAKFDDFILDENGRVVGVTYRKGYRFDSKLQSDDIENKSGRPATVKAKNGVMLAAGGSPATSSSVRLRIPALFRPQTPRTSRVLLPAC